jgi:hypothetical protein
VDSSVLGSELEGFLACLSDVEELLPLALDSVSAGLPFDTLASVFEWVGEGIFGMGGEVSWCWCWVWCWCLCVCLFVLYALFELDSDYVVVCLGR